MNKKKFYPFIVFYFALSLHTLAQSNYYLLYDKTLSEKTGAENLLTIHKAFYSFEEKYLPPTLVNKSKILNIGYRIAKTFVIDYPVDYVTILTQHEVFGHGARYREFGYINNSFHLSLPQPFGKGNGISYRGTSHLASTLDQNMTISFSGNESNTVLSDLIRTKWIMDDSVHYRDFLVYIESTHNISTYIYQTKWFIDHHKTLNSGNDINAYINDINAKYYYSTGKKYSINDLARHALINIFDPYQFISFYHWSNYLLTGKQKGKMFMIRIRDVSYLPSFNLALAPFGSEFYFNNYLKWNNRTFKVYARYGDPSFATFYGFGVSVFNIVQNKNLFINATADIWNQPSMTLQDVLNRSYKTTKGVGECISATAGINVFKSKFSIIAQGGYKTDGFVQGETLSKGFFIRAGLGFVNF